MNREFFPHWKDSALPPVLSIIGPTGSGKTQLAQDLAAQHLKKNQTPALLVSVDAVAVFLGLDIGSAKPSIQEQTQFQWRGVDLFVPTESVTARSFLEKVQDDITRALKIGRPIILAGGSMFYEKALVQGMSPGVASNPHYQKSLANFTVEELAQRLYRLDARFQEKAHPNDRYRLSRFLDLAEHQGLPYDHIFLKKIRPPFWDTLWTYTPTVLHGLDLSPTVLRGRLELRIDQMLETGWIEECCTLRLSYPPNSLAFASVGYSEIMAYLDNKIPMEDLKSEILTRHLQLAKKQRTWMRGLSKGPQTLGEL